MLEGRDAVLKDLDRLKQWADREPVGLSEGKCSILQLGQNNPMQPYRLDSGSNVAEKHLKVPVDKKLKRRQQCVSVTNKANNILYHNSEIVAMWRRAAIIPTTSGYCLQFGAFRHKRDVGVLE